MSLEATIEHARSGLADGGERGSRWIAVESSLAPVEFCACCCFKNKRASPLRLFPLLLSSDNYHPPYPLDLLAVQFSYLPPLSHLYILLHISLPFCKWFCLRHLFVRRSQELGPHNENLNKFDEQQQQQQ